MKITADFFKDYTPHPKPHREDMALMRVLPEGEGIRFALPSSMGPPVVTLHREDVLYLPLRIAEILQRAGFVEIMRIDIRDDTHELGISQSENMANVES